MTPSPQGNGFAWPPLPRDGTFPVVTGEDAVAQALRTLLHTEPGERIGRPTYGVGLRRFLFAPNTVGTRSAIRAAVLQAIQAFEPRARVAEVLVLSAESDPASIEIDIRYSVTGAPAPQSLVFPFYLDNRSPRGGA